jgi:hypothetical protein
MRTDSFSRAWLRAVPGLGALILVVAIAGLAAGVEPEPSGRKTLPSLASAGAEPVRVQGVIKESTRGSGKGAPVRLEVRSDDGAAIAVLLVADDNLDKLGLSLKTGERIDARGAMVPGKTPLLVATEVTADGRVVKVRETGSGKSVVPAPSPGAPVGSGAAGPP